MVPLSVAALCSTFGALPIDLSSSQPGLIWARCQVSIWKRLQGIRATTLLTSILTVVLLSPLIPPPTISTLTLLSVLEIDTLMESAAQKAAREAAAKKAVQRKAAKALLELTAAGVVEMKDEKFFSGDTVEGPVSFGPHSEATLWKTGGTTRLTALGIAHISYTLDLEDAPTELKATYLMYVNPAVKDYERNRKALIKVIQWFIANYNSGTTLTHDESALED